MTRREEIRNAAQAYYPSGTNHEEIKVASFIRGARYADKTMVEKFLYWLTMKSPFIDNKDMDKAIVELRKYLENGN